MRISKFIMSLLEKDEWERVTMNRHALVELMRDICHLIRRLCKEDMEITSPVTVREMGVQWRVDMQTVHQCGKGYADQLTDDATRRLLMEVLAKYAELFEMDDPATHTRRFALRLFVGDKNTP